MLLGKFTMSQTYTISEQANLRLDAESQESSQPAVPRSTAEATGELQTVFDARATTVVADYTASHGNQYETPDSATDLPEQEC